MDQDYAKIVPMMAGNVTPQGDWMVLSALRDSENMLVDYEGTPSGDWPGSPDGTMDLEIIKWLKACGAFKTVENKSGYFTDTLADAMALVPTSVRLINFNVNADMLYSTTPIPSIAAPIISLRCAPMSSKSARRRREVQILDLGR